MGDYDDFDCDFLSTAISETNREIDKIEKPAEIVSKKPYLSPGSPDNRGLLREILHRCDSSKSGKEDAKDPETDGKTSAKDIITPSTGGASRGGGRGRIKDGWKGKRRSKEEKEESENAAKTSLAMERLRSAEEAVVEMSSLDDSVQSLDDSCISINSDIQVVGEVKTHNSLRLSSDFTKTIKVKWKYEVKRITIGSDDSLGRLFDKFGAEVGKDPKELSFSLNGKELKRFDTCQSAGINLSSFVEARAAGAHSISKSSQEDDPDLIELKLQTCGESVRKTTHLMKTHLKTKFETVMQDFAEQRGKNVSNFKFMFDGEPLNPYENPEFLDLEGGEIIDVYETEKDLAPVVIPPPLSEHLPVSRGRGRGYIRSRGARRRGRGRRRSLNIVTDP